MEAFSQASGIFAEGKWLWRAWPKKRASRFDSFMAAAAPSGRGAGPHECVPRSASSRHVTRRHSYHRTRRGYCTKIRESPTAASHIERTLSGVTGTTLLTRNAKESVPAAAEALLESAVATSRIVYRQLIETPGFVEFFSQATPIDAIECSHIDRALRVELVAVQLKTYARFRGSLAGVNRDSTFLAWYGLGSAFQQACEADSQSWDVLSAEVKRWPFFATYCTTPSSASPQRTKVS